MSPLGVTTAENLQAVRRGDSALKEHHLEGMPEPFVGSLFSEPIGFEQGLISSIEKTVAEAATRGIAIDLKSRDVVFVISSTKGNVELLTSTESGLNESALIGASAEKIALHFGNPNRPIVVSNACISGCSALILGMRLLRSGQYKRAVVAGADIQRKFIVSGFQSFKALSPEQCRPFDADRCGLNLGEAFATMILSANEADATDDAWTICDGAVNNDANHISNPSRTAEGSLRAIEHVMQSCGLRSEDLAFISAHGTATLYNDEMEAVAISRAGMEEVPVFSLKGYYGHTMGAAGLLETIISIHAAEEGWVPATRGFEEEGTSRQINVSGAERAVALSEDGSQKRSVLKLLSGFGGCNAAVVLTKDKLASETSVVTVCEEIEGTEVLITPQENQTLTQLYKDRVGDYPKFYKMDPLCKLGFLAAEEAFGKLTETIREEGRANEDVAIVLCSRCGSLADDLAYFETISDVENYYPSPAVFVYTLSNIVTGEIAIRNHCYGETSCYIFDEKDPEAIRKVIDSAFADSRINMVLGGWVDYEDAQHFEADIRLYRRK